MNVFIWAKFEAETPKMKQKVKEQHQEMIEKSNNEVNKGYQEWV